MKIYIAGRITGETDYKIKFAKVEYKLKSQGHSVMNPARLNEGFEWDEYMQICFKMIDICEAVFMLSDWQSSKGAKAEYCYALTHGKTVYFEGAKNGLLENCGMVRIFAE